MGPKTTREPESILLCVFTSPNYILMFWRLFQPAMGFMFPQSFHFSSEILLLFRFLYPGFFGVFFFVYLEAVSWNNNVSNPIDYFLFTKPGMRLRAWQFMVLQFVYMVEDNDLLYRGPSCVVLFLLDKHDAFTYDAIYNPFF